MRALTLTQPWASLVAIGAKRIETRSWPTAWRGPLAIHAAQGFPAAARRCCYEQAFRIVLDWHELNPANLPRGVVLATCRLVDCVPTEDAELLSGLTWFESSFGDYSPGRWAWVLDDIQPLAHPVPARGALGLWSWKEER